MESAHGPALFHVGREEGCESYVVAFLESRTAFVTLSVSPLTSTFSGPLVEALIGAGAAPLDWLEYWRTAEASPRRRLALLATLVLLAGAVTVAATRVVRTRRAAALADG